MFGDAAQPAMMSGAYVSYEQPGKGVLGNEDRPLPQRELQALSNTADVVSLLTTALGSWVEEVMMIARSLWLDMMYEKMKLHVYH